MKPAVRDLAIGFTALIGLIGLVLILLLFGELSIFTDRAYTVTYRLDTAAGLVRGSRVTLNGVPIGEVADMVPIIEPTPGVEVSVRIREDIFVPRNSRVAIAVGLLGDGALALTSTTPVRGEGRPQFLEDGDVVTAEASTIFDEFAELIENRLSEINRAAASVAELSGTYARVGERIYDLLGPRTPEQVDAGDAAPGITTVVARLDRVLADADKWLADEALRTDFHTAVRSVNERLGEASEAIAAVRAAAESVEQQSEALGPRLDSVVTDIRRTADAISIALEDVRQITSRINAGEGTAGQLIVNPDLYRSLTDAAIRLERVLVEGQLLIEKWKAEGLPIQF